MFELLVEILHRDDSWTREPYATCQVVRHSQTGGLARMCQPTKYPTREARLTQLQKLDAQWSADSRNREGPKAWVRWEMRCERVEGPPTS